MTRTRIVQFLLFVLVGGVSAGIDAGGFILLTGVGLTPILASPTSFLASFFFNFFANRSLVFRAKPERWQIVRYTALVTVNTLISTGLVAGGIAIGVTPPHRETGDDGADRNMELLPPAGVGVQTVQAGSTASGFSDSESPR